MTEIRFVDLARQYESIKSEVDAALIAVAESTQYILGEEVDRFEDEFAAYCETRHCVGVASGTAAIQLALEALGVGPGDEVIAPANTFIATILPVLRLGARPVLVDCDPETATIDVAQAAAAMGPQTKALIAVHLFGHPADVDALAEACDSHGVVLVEDACQAHGARYKGRRTGGLGRVAAFSFYPGKNLGALGDAGAVTTNDDELADQLRVLGNLGQRRKYDHVVAGWNERLDTIQAAVLRVKLEHLDRWNDLRREHADAYSEVLAATDLVLPETASWAEHVWHLYVVRSPRRDELAEALRAEGIETGMHYPCPLHLQPALAQLGYSAGEFPVTEAWARELLSLPMFPELEQSEIQQVAAGVSGSAPAARPAAIRSAR
jgi:dTDP-4-amino-4,6-dideoxygalactose transaminase